ncbi:MAG TPA: DUF2950 family protein [Candidatus Binatia bacterium]|nr:DUF2950 family protein [Candidatus Binatia bacterium]
MRSLVLIVALAVVLPGCWTRQADPNGAAPPAPERHFANPKAAVEALLGACRTDDETALIAIFGSEAKPLVSMNGDDANRERCRRLVAAAAQSTRLDPRGSDTLQLVVGTDDWPFPIPLVRDGSSWHFDTQRGLEEVVRRRIGADELEAIRVCRAYVRAQEEYARRVGRGSYAERLVSTPGTRDGLYWPSTKPGDESPLAGLVASAEDPPRSWWGYNFRILTAQGAAAPGGARSYLVGGRMVGGFALVAYPVDYGTSGIMTFVVSKDGEVFSLDLGSITGAIAERMTAYDPGKGWSRVAD